MGTPLSIMSWNVNSVRARKDRLFALLSRHAPDVLCLQESKVLDEDFPVAEVEGLGYHCEIWGQRAYNGVALISKTPITDVGRGFDDDFRDPQARFIHGEVRGVRVCSAYIPNGRTVGSDKWFYKREWLGRLRGWLDRRLPMQPLALCGDFNVAPTDADVSDPAEWKDTVLTHPQARGAYQKILDWGLTDTFRMHVQDAGKFSWWDYRQLGFQKDNGLRIDFVFATEGLAQTCTGAWIDREERKGKGASDHAPVVADFDWAG
jgi:exodeoxyribonuclease-3